MRLTGTRVRTLLVLALAAATFVLAVDAVADPVLPAVGWSVPASVAAVAAAVLVATLGFRRRLRGVLGARPYDPLQAARMVVLAKAASHGGALLAGGYLGLAAALVLGSSATARRVDGAYAGGAALTALVLVALGLWLERICRVPPGGDGASPGPPGAAGVPGG